MDPVLIEHCFIRPDDICELRIAEGAVLDPSAMMQLVKARNRVLAGRRLPLIMVLPRAFDYRFSTLDIDPGPEMDDVVSMAAIVCPDPGRREIATVYYGTVQRPYPTAVVADEEEALAWIKARLG